MMNAYGSDTPLEAIGREKNLKILLAHRVGCETSLLEVPIINRHNPYNQCYRDSYQDRHIRKPKSEMEWFVRCDKEDHEKRIWA